MALKRRRSILFIAVLLLSLDLDVLCGSLDDPGKARAGASQPSNLHLAGVLGRELADRRPVEFVAAMGQQCQEPVTQEASKRQRHAQIFSGSKGEPNILVAEGCREPG